MPEEKKDFIIKDRRAFSEEDTVADEAEGSQTAPESETPKQAPPEGEATAGVPMPEINFPTFLMSLNMSAMLHLGLVEDPVTGEKTKNLPMAKQTIDILSLMEEKTKGNLTDDEDQILKGILYDLRINYVRAKS